MARCTCPKPQEYIKDSGEEVVGGEVWLITSIWCKRCERFVRFDRLHKRKKR